MNQKTRPSIIERLQAISKELDEIISYNFETTDDMTDVIDFGKIQDLVDRKIKDMKSND